MPSPVSAVLLRGALLLGSLVVAYGLGELVVRILDPQQLIVTRPDIWQSRDTVGWKFRANLRTTLNWGERTVHLYTDSEGFRVGSAGRVDANTRVLLIGDSFMAALQVEYEQSLAGLIEHRLNQRLGRPVAIRNTGQAGWDPPQYYAEARRILARDTFDLVLVALYVGNDVVLVRRDRIPPRMPEEVHHLRVPRRFTWDEWVAAVLYPVNDFLKARSHLFLLVKTRLNATLMRFGLTAEYFPVEFRRHEATSPRWGVTTGICADLAALAARRGIPIVFVLLPAPFQIDRGVFTAYLQGFHIDPSQVDLDQPTRLLRDSLTARGLRVIDVLPEFRGAGERGENLYGRIDRHLSAAGHELLEELLEPTVVRILQTGKIPRAR